MGCVLWIMLLPIAPGLLFNFDELLAAIQVFIHALYCYFTGGSFGVRHIGFCGGNFLGLCALAVGRAFIPKHDVS